VILVGYAPEGAVSAFLLLAPIALGIASLRPSARGHWSGPLLASPSLLYGMAFSCALARDGPGYGGFWIIVYTILLWVLGFLSVGRWIRGKGERV
jgi:hypothetical protein